jgi:hypothetical protein
MQQDVNKRTEEFTKQHPDAAKWTDKEKAFLQALRRDQQEVADLIEEMNRPGDDPGEPEGDKP